MPSTDAKWIIGVVLVLGGILIAQNVGIRNDIADIRTDMRRLDDRLRAVEIALGKVDQRLATLERTILPGAQPD